MRRAHAAPIAALMLSGDLDTMSLADIFQWADQNRVAGALILERPTGDLAIHIEQRRVSAVQLPSACSVPLEQLDPTQRALSELPIAPPLIALESLYDQFLDAQDRFHFDVGAKPNEQAVELDISLQELVMEGLRHLDEWPDIRGLYPNDHARVRVGEGPRPAQPSLLARALLSLAERSVTLSDARLCLGISRAALLRNVEALRRLGSIEVDGAPQGGNLIDELIDKATLLLREKQFDEASHVLAALLSAEPGSQRIRNLLRDAERDHIEFLYRTVPADAVVLKRPRLSTVEARLSRPEREVVERVNDRWDVSTLVLASPLREAETLKALRKLLRMEAVALQLPGQRPGR